MTRAVNDRAIVGAAVGLPVLALLLHHDTGHLGDIEFFHEWYLAFRQGAGFYRDGPGLNYPIGGVLLVALPATLVESGQALSLASYTWVLKSTLAVGEMGLILSVAALLRRFHVRSGWACAIYLCPSTWAPGAWFGQIDCWTSAMLVLALVGVVDYRRTGRARALALALSGAWCAILIKQLACFTLPAIALGLAPRLARAPRAHPIGAALSVLVLFVADPLLELPEGWSSHFAWVWLGGGSSHADFIVAGGASLWSLIADVNASAHEWRCLGVSAYSWGLVLFAAAQAPLLWGWAKNRDPVRYAASCNLAMCVFLTGVHERYFVHGSVLLLVVAFGEPRWRRLITWFVCAWWGLYVLASLYYDAFAGWPFRWHVPTAILLLAAFFVWLPPRARDPVQ